MKKFTLIIVTIFAIFLLYKDYQLRQELKIIQIGIILVESDPELDFMERNYQIAVLQSNTAYQYYMLKKNLGF